MTVQIESNVGTCIMLHRDLLYAFSGQNHMMSTCMINMIFRKNRVSSFLEAYNILASSGMSG